MKIGDKMLYHEGFPWDPHHTIEVTVRKIGVSLVTIEVPQPDGGSRVAFVNRRQLYPLPNKIDQAQT